MVIKGGANARNVSTAQLGVHSSPAVEAYRLGDITGD